MKPRARDLNIPIGQLQPGPLNAITDVPGVRVGHSDVRGRTANGRDILTGVTVIEPRAGSTSQQPCFAGVHVLNGNGDATGLEWIREAGLLTSPIAFTNTHSLGVVRDALIVLDREQQPDDGRLYWNMPVVLETFDGLLNDINGFHVKPEHVAQAVRSATGGPVAEGNVGGGSGIPKPGEISLSHRGVLFLDELPQFRREVVDLLRAPLEEGEVLLARA
ncbi:MAG: P1 family peptidase, partial [Pseudomonas fluorescens]|nr:P1 family peptidase [Pseudomonas fluorescens]